MGEITFFTSESYNTSDKNDNDIVSYDLTIKTSTHDVRTFLASNFDKKAVVSFSELFSPYTTNSGIDTMPRANFRVSRAEENSAGSGDCRQEVLAEDIASGVNYGLCPTYSGDAQLFDKDDVDNINSIAFRCPIMVAGYGYTTEGLPYPSMLDQHITDSTGTYNPTAAESGHNQLLFADNAKNRVDMWKSGPLDTRWDKHKNMFVAAPEMFIGYALCDIPACSGRWAPVLGGFQEDDDGNQVLDGSGNPILLPGYPTFTSGEIECAIGRYDEYHVPSGSNGRPTHKLLIINRSVSMDISSGSLVIGTRLNNGENFPIFVDCVPDTM